MKAKTRPKDGDDAYLPKNDPCQVDHEDRKKRGRLGAIEKNLMLEENDDVLKIPKLTFKTRKDTGKPRKHKLYASKAEGTKAWRTRMKSQGIYPTKDVLVVRKEIELCLRAVWDAAILAHVDDGVR